MCFSERVDYADRYARTFSHISIVSIVSIMSKSRKTRCPKKWIGFGSSCYFLSEESKTWDEAREFCRARGADLVVINTEEENEFISALKKQQVWIGLTDRDLEGTWKSVDGSSLNLTFWGSGQPDDYDAEEDCGETNFEFLGHWNDVPCHLSRQLISLTVILT
uniref:C-type lectin domain-containing protein n=1 Tax=Oryzias latipes TaxID=8090 RepID=A0A3P9L175_ORYLA